MHHGRLTLLLACGALACRRPAAPPIAAADISSPVVRERAPVPPAPAPVAVGGIGQIQLLALMVVGASDADVPVRVRITDPNGRSTGRRAGPDAAVNEIPRGRYFAPYERSPDVDPPLDAYHNITITDPAPGRYLLELAGIGPQRYVVYLNADRTDGRTFWYPTTDCAAAIGRVDSVRIEIRADSAVFTGNCTDAKRVRE